MNLLKVKNLSKTYVSRFGSTKVEALKNVSFEINKIGRASCRVRV